MGTYISGWVESSYAGIFKDPDEVGKWHPVLNIGLIIETHNYQLFALLFGVRNNDGNTNPIAPYRGVPADASSLVKSETTGQYPSWALWREITNCGWQKVLGESPWDDDWRLVFAVMEFLSNHYGENYVRLVVDFF
jgi:hypothetical protein